MARVELNIVALGDFKSVNTQIANLKSQVELLNKSITGVGINSNLAKQLQEANNAFKSTLLSTGQFTAQTVKLKAETEKFGEALASGKLKLHEYFNIIKGGTANATAQMKALAIEQTKLQNSIVMTDPSKQGVLSVFTPTRINEAANATKIAGNMQNLYNIAVDKGTQSLINWGKNTQWAGRQLTVGMTVPLTIFGSTAAKTFQDVNEEIVRLQKVYGTGLSQPTQAVLDQIKAQVLGLSKELAAGLGVSVKDTTAMAADLAATGLQGQQLIDATRQSIRLSKLGELDQQAAMKATVSLQNVYKLSTQQLSGAVNFLNAVENQTSTSLQDLVDGIPRVGPIVQQLGGSFKDTAIMMVAMKEAGVPAAQSANAIKSAIASLINPTKAAKDAFAAYNINLSSIATNSKGNPVQMIMMLQGALKGLQPLVQAQLIEKLFGKFQEARIQALITNLGAANSQTKTAFDLMNASDAQLSTIAQGELKTATESVTGKFKRAVETMKADLLPVGEKILEIATTLMNFGNSIAKVFSGLPGPVKTVMGIIAAGVALSGPVIMFTGVLANFVGYLMKGLFALVQLKNGTKTFGELFTPEIIASQNAAQLFSNKILEDESAVSLLNKAVRELTVSLEGMAAAMSASAGTGFAGKILAAEAGLAGGRIPFKAPGMATGGWVPGNPSHGDNFPAMLMGGEAVIPTKTAQKFAPFINGMLKGSLPGFAKGKPVDGEPTWINPGRWSAPSDSPFAGVGKEVLDLVGDLQKGQSILDGIIAQYGLTKKALVDQLRGADVAHIQKEVQDGNKLWRAGNLTASFSVENKMLEYATRKGPLGDAFRQSIEAASNAIPEALKSKYTPEEIAKATASVRIGQQPINELESAIYHETLQDMKRKVAAGIVKKSAASTRWLDAAAAITAERQAGGSLAPASELLLSKQLNIASKAASPSKETAKAAKNMVDGVTETLKDSKIQISDATEQGIIGPLMQSGAFYSNSNSKTGVLSRLRNSQGKLSLGARMGGSMALMMGGQMLGNALPQGSNISSMFNSASNMAGMGMMFGPWGAAAGAALGLVTSGISALIRAEKEHKAIAQSTFTASTDAIKMFGGATVDAKPPVFDLTNALGKGLPKIAGFALETKNFKDAILKLPKDNPMSGILTQMQDAKSDEQAKKLAEAFAATQVAINGMDPAAAQKMIDLYLAASGHSAAIGTVKAPSVTDATKQLLNAGSAKAGISKNQQAAMDMYKRQMDAFSGNTGSQFYIQAKLGYDALSKQKAGAVSSEQAAKNITNVTNSMIGGAATAADYRAKLEGVKASTNNTSAAVQIYAQNLTGADAKQKNNVAALGQMGLKLSEVIPYLKLASVQPNSPILAQIAKDAQNKNTEALAKDMAALNKEIDKLLNKNPNGILPKVGDASTITSTGIFSGTSQEKDLKKKLEAKIKSENSILKTLRDQLSVEQKRTQEMQRQHDYQNNMTDLQNQAKEAMISGNYLQAAGLRQQQQFATMQFGQTTNQNVLQGKIDAIQARADVFSEALADLNDAIANGVKTINKTILQRYNLPTLNASNIAANSAGIVINSNIQAGLSKEDLSRALDANKKDILNHYDVQSAKNQKTNKIYAKEGQHFRGVK